MTPLMIPSVQRRCVALIASLWVAKTQPYKTMSDVVATAKVFDRYLDRGE